MKLDGSKLKGLPVVTVSGERLGQIQNFELDPDQHLITVYIVGPSRLVRPLQSAPLRIGRSQVCSITAERMIVEDGVRRERSGASARARLAKPIVPAISTRA